VFKTCSWHPQKEANKATEAWIAYPVQSRIFEAVFSLMECGVESISLRDVCYDAPTSKRDPVILVQNVGSLPLC